MLIQVFPESNSSWSCFVGIFGTGAILRGELDVVIDDIRRSVRGEFEILQDDLDLFGVDTGVACDNRRSVWIKECNKKLLRQIEHIHADMHISWCKLVEEQLEND